MPTLPDRFEYEAKRWHDAGDRVVVESVQRGWLASGPEYSTPVNNVWTFDFAAPTPRAAEPASSLRRRLEED
jgi:hypothetical protein